MIFLLNLLIVHILTLITNSKALNPLLSSKVVTDGIGVNIHFTNPRPGELEMIADAGFKWVRMDFKWHAIEKNRGEYDFKEYDNLMGHLEKQKIHAYFILDYSNELYEKNTSVVTSEGRAAYAKFTSAAVEHFKGRGIIWEIWNEPNGFGFWKPHPNVTQYIQMALESVKAIRAKTPNEVIIGPAVSGIDFHFLEPCIKSELINYWDAISVHPYRRTGPETVTVDYQKLQKLISQYAPKGKVIPIVSGEWGYSDVWDTFNRKVQGKYLSREFLVNFMNNIPISIWYDWHDDGGNKIDPEHHFGTVQVEYHKEHNPVYTPKPAYLAIKTLSSALNGYHYVKRIKSNDVHEYVLLFNNDHNLKVVLWTAFGETHEIKIPSDKCDFQVIHSEDNTHETVSSDGGHLSIEITNFPKYITVKCLNHALLNATEEHV